MQPVKSPFRDSLSNALLLELKGIDGTVWEWLYNVSISSKAKQLFGFKGVHAMQ